MDIPAIPEGERQAQIYPTRIWADHEPTDDGEFKEVHWIEYAKKGSVETTTDKVARLEKSAHLWAVLGPSYDAWTKNQAPPVDGTPLDAWSGLTPGMAAHLKSLNIRSVEDIACMTDNDMERVGMGARAIRDKALAFVEIQMDTAKVQNIIAEQKQTIKRQGDQIDELREAVERLSAETQKKKPGRPRRQPTDAAAGLSEVS